MDASQLQQQKATEEQLFGVVDSLVFVVVLI